MMHRWGDPLQPVPQGFDTKQKCTHCDLTRLSLTFGRRTYYEFKRGNRFIDKPGVFMNGTPPCEGKKPQ